MKTRIYSAPVVKGFRDKNSNVDRQMELTMNVEVSERTRNKKRQPSGSVIIISPVLVECWDSVNDAVPTFKQHWAIVSFLPGTYSGYMLVPVESSFTQSGCVTMPRHLDSHCSLSHPFCVYLVYKFCVMETC